MTNREELAIAERMKNKKMNGSSNFSHGDKILAVRKSKPSPFDKARANVVKTFLTVSVFFVSCWSMNEIIFFIAAFGYKLDYTGVPYILSVFLVCLHCCINPFIYAIQYTDFQVGVKRIMKAKCLTRT